jgi:hypothetical protein
MILISNLIDLLVSVQELNDFGLGKDDLSAAFGFLTSVCDYHFIIISFTLLL